MPGNNRKKVLVLGTLSLIIIGTMFLIPKKMSLIPNSVIVIISTSKIKSQEEQHKGWRKTTGTVCGRRRNRSPYRNLITLRPPQKFNNFGKNFSFNPP